MLKVTLDNGSVTKVVDSETGTEQSFEVETQGSTDATPVTPEGGEATATPETPTTEAENTTAPETAATEPQA